MRILAGDIGATKSILALFEAEASRFRAVREQTFNTSHHSSLASMVLGFLSEATAKIDGTCFGVAGPVAGDACPMVNLPWAIDARQLGIEIGVERTRIVNDFHAIGHGLARLEAADLVTLQTGRPVPGETIAVIGAGTGLGEGYLTWSGDRYQVQSSEGGHTDFAPRNDVEIGLLNFLRARYDHVSYERILSGPGLFNIYEYLVETRRAAGSSRIRAEMEQQDPAAVISHHALAGSDDACSRALDLFVSVYGAEAGNLALKLWAASGVYVAGGIALRILPKLKDGSFIRAFRGKGRHRVFLEAVPVHVVINPRVGLLGAASIAARAEECGNRDG